MAAATASMRVSLKYLFSAAFAASSIAARATERMAACPDHSHGMLVGIAPYGAQKQVFHPGLAKQTRALLTKHGHASSASLIASSSVVGLRESLICAPWRWQRESGRRSLPCRWPTSRLGRLSGDSVPPPARREGRRDS